MVLLRSFKPDTQEIVHSIHKHLQLMWSLWSKNNCSCLSLHWFYVVSSDPFSCPGLSLPALGMPGALLPLRDQSLNIQLLLGRTVCFWLGLPLFLSNVPCWRKSFSKVPRKCLKSPSANFEGDSNNVLERTRKITQLLLCTAALFLLITTLPNKQTLQPKMREVIQAPASHSVSRTAKRIKVQVLLPHDCTFAVRLSVLWASVYRCLIIFISIHTHIFSSEFKDKDISHSSQTAISYVFHRSCKERELLNQEEALTMQTLLCKIAFKKHLLFMV